MAVDARVDPKIHEHDLAAQVGEYERLRVVPASDRAQPGCQPQIRPCLRCVVSLYATNSLRRFAGRRVVSDQRSLWVLLAEFSRPTWRLAVRFTCHLYSPFDRVFRRPIVGDDWVPERRHAPFFSPGYLRADQSAYWSFSYLRTNLALLCPLSAHAILPPVPALPKS